MFNIGLPELLIIMVVALLIIGPKKLPEVAKSMGKGFGEFKRAMNDLRDTVNIDDTGNNSKGGNSNSSGSSHTQETSDKIIEVEPAPNEATESSETAGQQHRADQTSTADNNNQKEKTT
ncbi:twin-arginine translocase TatA/TatE family subunit [Desulfurispira natronophila]|uniref:Sec-independent protein translocase protein TatA n=1 Tax=Desulfurispira natronophila TaxID=682562 RepID=A0A7W7Y3V3_9BACT|nr:twin-arginine translocase TatA/TatE family subunit [Desulfurispira natronophila]MBB5021327.1 sec-independent protein translocase protein TatA/sec-independent protein translocase protein TatB [Desulfurispira natronophila]